LNRDKLIAQVKQIYAELASDEDQRHFRQTTAGIGPDEYYENILDMVIGEIGRGTFDSFHDGHEVVEAVANDKARWLSEWEENRLVSR